jgi:hypothetical protein
MKSDEVINAVFSDILTLEGVVDATAAVFGIS